MPAIVMNTRNTAVTEWDVAFQSITPTHAGDASGLYGIGGAYDGPEDAPVAIAARVLLPLTALGTLQQKGLSAVYMTMTGEAGSTGALIVQLPDETEYAYEDLVREGRMSRFVPGKGIREEYLAIGYENRGGADFRIDEITPEITTTKTRRL